MGLPSSPLGVTGPLKVFVEGHSQILAVAHSFESVASHLVWYGAYCSFLMFGHEVDDLAFLGVKFHAPGASPLQ